MKTGTKSRSLLLVIVLLASLLAKSQSYQDSLKKDDDDIISSIAPYPEDVRNAILNVSQYPQKLVKVERIQARSSQSFQDLVADYSRDQQEKFYDLARYPDLVHQLATSSYNTFDQVKPMLDHYPKELEPTVSSLFSSHLKEIRSMDKMYQTSQAGFDQVIESLPADAQSDFKKVIGMPDVMSLLTEHINLVVSLGEAYKNDPQGTRQKLNEVSLQVTAQNQTDLDEYKKKVENDPQMQEEMKRSSQEFADSYSANNDAPYDTQLQGQQSQAQNQPTVINNYYGGYGSNYNPYPYWFGYPYWYSSAMWYPMPLYYYTGYYIGPRGNVVVMGLPSRYYSNWFFSFGYHRYPRYYGFCNTYYSTHRTIVNRVNVYNNFHRDVFNHFSHSNNVNINRNTTINRNNTFNRNERTNNHRNLNGQNNNGWRNSIHNNGNNFNQQHLNHFNATQFHQQNWQHVGGGNRGGGGFRGGSGGGGHAGGGRGRH